MNFRKLVVVATLAACGTLGFGQPKPKPPKATATPQPPQIDEKLFNAMRWRQVGPFRGGRVLAVTGVPGEPSVFYFGGASSGVWKSSDAGANWQPTIFLIPL